MKMNVITKLLIGIGATLVLSVSIGTTLSIVIYRGHIDASGAERIEKMKTKHAEKLKELDAQAKRQSATAEQQFQSELDAYLQVTCVMMGAHITHQQKDLSNVFMDSILIKGPIKGMWVEDAAGAPFIGSYKDQKGKTHIVEKRGDMATYYRSVSADSLIDGAKVGSVTLFYSNESLDRIQQELAQRKEEAIAIAVAEMEKFAEEVAHDKKEYTSALLLNRSIEGAASITIISIVIYIIYRATLYRSLRGSLVEVQQLADTISRASHEMQVVSETQATSSTEQAASLVEACSSIETMNDTARENLQKSNEASKLTEEALASTEEGGQRMVRMREAMEDIRTATDGIAQIIQTIEEIAFQTNLLALNAAVEAARAGEAGTGFAVVADEVRTLAQKSSAAALDSSQLIEQTISKSQHGDNISREVAESLSEITDRVKRVDAFISNIAHSSAEQSDGIGQIREGMLLLQQTTQQSSMDSETSARNGNELKAGSDKMGIIVADLQDLLGIQFDVGAAPASASPQFASSGQSVESKSFDELQELNPEEFERITKTFDLGSKKSSYGSAGNADDSMEVWN